MSGGALLHRVALAVAALASLTAGGGPSFAAMQSGSAALPDSNYPRANGTEARQTTRAFAKCLLNKSGYRMKPLLEKPVGGRSDLESWLPFFDSNCLLDSTDTDQASLRFKINLIRGDIYEIMLARDLPEIVAADIDGNAKAVRYPEPEQPVTAMGTAYLLSMNIGDCTVRAQPGAALALMKTAIGSQEERAAVKALVPTIGTCTPNGASMTFSYSIIRAMVAEPIYRLTRAKFEMAQR